MKVFKKVTLNDSASRKAKSSAHEAKGATMPKYRYISDRLTVKDGVLTIDATGLEGRVSDNTKARYLLHKQNSVASQKYINVPGVPGMEVSLEQREGKLLGLVEGIVLPDPRNQEDWNSAYGTKLFSRCEAADNKGRPCQVAFRCRVPEE